MPKKGEYNFPLRVISRKGEKYIYVGDVPNVPHMRKHLQAFGRDNGRKTAFVVDPMNKLHMCHYVSAKFYNGPHVVRYPAYGKETLYSVR